MKFRATIVSLLAVLALACEAGSGSDSDSGSEVTGPSGSCPLYRACTRDEVEGRTYCDEIDGELTWGACQTDPPCELGQPGQGCQVCDLVDGVLVLSGSPTCECEAPGPVPACEQTECSQTWSFSCGNCQSFVGGGGCLEYDLGCSDPLLRCQLERPCPRVWAQGYDSLDSLEDGVDPAICVLTSLRDNVVGEYELLWGEMGDDGWVTAIVHASGDGTVFVEWEFSCPGCSNFGLFGRTGVLALRDPSFFAECLSDPTEDSLIGCLIGLSGPGVPDGGFLPPFTTGTCESLEPACP
jgi:hypothetical protein